MSQISHIGADPGISNDQVGLRELLNSIDSRKYVLVTGPGMVMPPRVEDGRGSQESSSYLKRLLKGIVEWCIQNEIFTKKDVIGEIRQLLQKEALIHVGYKIEEYLVERSELQRCLAGLLLYDAPIEELHRFVACLPFRGYISMTYDTFIETACEQVYQRELPKFYASSIQTAVDTCRSGRPFILKPYGDISDPDSLIIGHRLAKGLSFIKEQELLRSLLATAPMVCAGFEKDDPDLRVLDDIVKSSAKTDQLSIYDLIVYDEQLHVSEDRYVQEYQRSGNTLREIPLARSGLMVSSIVDVRPFPRASVEDGLKEIQITVPGLVKQEEPGKENRQKEPVEVFVAYTVADKKYFEKIDNILCGIKNVKKELHIDYKAEVVYKKVIPEQAKLYLTAADLILLLVSQTFLATDFCCCEQMETAVGRHGPRTYIVPIIVQPASLWKDTPFGKLEALPKGELALSQLGGKQQEALDEINKALICKIGELQLLK